LALPSLAALPQSPITFTAVPSFSSLVQKLDSFVAACPAPSFNVKAALQDARKVVVKETIPWLERHAKGLQSAPAMSTTSAQAFQRAAHTLQQHLSPDQLFPLLDITRLLLLHPPFVASLAQNDKLVPSLLQRAAESESRPTVLTATRLLTNALVHPPLCTTLQEYVRQLPTALLHADAAVRSAAASASFNAGLGVSHRLPLIRLPDAPAPAAAPEDDWDVELAPALLEAAQREESDETRGSCRPLRWSLAHISSQCIAHSPPCCSCCTTRRGGRTSCVLCCRCSTPPSTVARCCASEQTRSCSHCSRTSSRCVERRSNDRGTAVNTG
jgi:hypothetical protein